MKKRVIISLTLFIIVTILVFTNNTIWFDEKVYNLIYSFNNDNLTTIMKFITFLSSVEFIITVSILSLITIWFNKKDSLYLVGTIILSSIINIILKMIFRRARPDHFRHVTELTYSYPSGHAMASASFYGGIIVLVNNSKIKKEYKLLIIIALLILIFLIGVSRIYLGVHHASDVIASWLLSYIILNYLDKLVKEKK